MHITETYYKGKRLSTEEYENNQEAQATLPTLDLVSTFRTRLLNFEDNVAYLLRVSEYGIHLIPQDYQHITFGNWVLACDKKSTIKNCSIKTEVFDGDMVEFINGRKTIKSKRYHENVNFIGEKIVIAKNELILPVEFQTLLIDLGIHATEISFLKEAKANQEFDSSYFGAVKFAGIIEEGPFNILVNRDKAEFIHVTKNLAIRFIDSTNLNTDNGFILGRGKVYLEFVIRD